MRDKLIDGEDNAMRHYHAIAVDTVAHIHELIAQIHELGRDRKRDGYLELNLRRDGNEYAEITPCSEAECSQWNDQFGDS